jgi:DNA-binding GntR family transcriptional regulator
MNGSSDSPDWDSFATPESLSQAVYGYLEKEIIEGRLRAGTRLMPEDIAKMLKVSKSPVREALKALEKVGFVTNRVRSGFFVAEIKLKDIEEIVPIRAALWRIVLKAIVESEYKPDFIPTLEDILKKVEHWDQKERDINVEEYFYLLARLYKFLEERSPNRWAAKMLEQLDKHVFRYSFVSLSNKEYIRRSLEMQKRLIKAIKEKDVETSVALGEAIPSAALDFFRVSGG